MTEAQRTMKLAEEANARKAEKFEKKCNAYARKVIRKINAKAMKGAIVFGVTLRKKYSNSIVHKYLTDRGYSIKIDYKNGRDFLTIKCY